MSSALPNVRGLHLLDDIIVVRTFKASKTNVNIVDARSRRAGLDTAHRGRRQVSTTRRTGPPNAGSAGIPKEKGA